MLPVTTGTTTSTTIRFLGATGSNQSGNHVLAGYIEWADVVETSRDSGIWKVGYTVDGLHGNSTSYPLMVAAINLSAFKKY